MATANPTEGLRGPGTIIKRASGWLIAMAVVFSILGMFAIVEPAIAGLPMAILVGWLVVRWIIRRGGAGVAQTQLRAWANRGASLLALAIVGGMLWHVMTVAAVNRLPRQDVDGSPVYERMDAITKK